MSDATDPTALTGGLKVVPGVDFPLPPAELADKLANPDLAAASKPASRPADTVAEGSKPVAELDYVDGLEEAAVPIARPFRLDGVVVDRVVARPLTLAEVGHVLTANPAADVFDFYAAMTGLPAPVIRALRGADGDNVTGACFPFLPRFMRPAGG